MKISGELRLVAVVLWSLGAAAHAEDVYKWTDREAIINFSSTAPPATAKDVEIIPVQPPGPRLPASNVQAEIDQRVERYNRTIEILRDIRAAKMGITRKQLDILEDRAAADIRSRH